MQFDAPRHPLSGTPAASAKRLVGRILFSVQLRGISLSVAAPTCSHERVTEREFEVPNPRFFTVGAISCNLLQLVPSNKMREFVVHVTAPLCSERERLMVSR